MIRRAGGCFECAAIFRECSKDAKGTGERIQPRVAEFPVSAISLALGVTGPHATDIRAGKRRPHQRHRLRLAKLADGA
jgi:hypothetical protein